MPKERSRLPSSSPHLTKPRWDLRIGALLTTSVSTVACTVICEKAQSFILNERYHPISEIFGSTINEPFIMMPKTMFLVLDLLTIDPIDLGLKRCDLLPTRNSSAQLEDP